MRETLNELFERADLEDCDRFGLAELTDWGISPAFLPFLTPASTPETINCQGCEESCRMPIIKHVGSALVWCDKQRNMGAIKILSEELDFWRVDMQELATWLARSLGQPEPISIVRNRIYDLGRFEEKTLFLARGLGWTDGADALNDYRIRNAQPFFISLSAPPQNFAYPALWIGQLLSIQNGKLVAHIDRLRVDPRLSPTFEGNIFRKEGDFWRICFEGKEASIKHSNGTVYIDYLLHQPNEEVPAMVLQGLINKPPPQDAAPDNAVTVDPAMLESDPLLDQEARRQVKEKIAKLKENDPNSKETAKLEAYLKTDSYKGRSKQFANDNEKARGAVTKAINSVKKKIKTALPALGAHLDAHVKTGTFCKYAPTEKAKWD